MRNGGHGLSFHDIFRAPSIRPRSEPLKTHWVRDAVFYFEAELELASLVKQRRRWLNGTAAGYLYLLMNISLVWEARVCSNSNALDLFTS